MNKNFAVAAAVAALLAACGGSDNQPARPVAQLFAQTNDTNNMVLHYLRSADGSLAAQAAVSTGGKGTNGVNYFMGKCRGA